MFKAMREMADREPTHTHVVFYRSEDDGKTWAHAGIVMLSQDDADFLHEQYSKGTDPGTQPV